MRKRLSILATALLLVLPAAHARDIIHKGDVVVVPLQGEISPSLLTFLRRALKAAESSGASAIVLEMNTYGGRLDSAEEITSALNHATIPTYTFINSKCGLGRRAHCAGHAAYLHGAGQRDWRRRAGFVHR